MKKTLAIAVLLATFEMLSAQIVTDLWPEGMMPGDNGLTEVAVEDGTFQLVTHPLLEVYLPDSGKANGQAVVICPGGSYLGLAFNHEGRDVARWLAEGGTAGIVLKYRMPGGHRDIPRADVGQAIKIVRENADEWGLDPARVGVMGFSAGGHLASTALTHFTDPALRPGFGILVYPVISMSDELTHVQSRYNLTGAEKYSPQLDEFSNETRVTGDTPPVLILFSHDDDGVDVRNGVVFYEACAANGVPAEIHTFSSGGHGWGWLEEFTYSDEVRLITRRWLSER